MPTFVSILYTYTMLLCIKHRNVLQQQPSHTGLYFAGYMPRMIGGASRGVYVHVIWSCSITPLYKYTHTGRRYELLAPDDYCQGVQTNWAHHMLLFAQKASCRVAFCPRFADFAHRQSCRMVWVCRGDWCSLLVSYARWNPSSEHRIRKLQKKQPLATFIMISEQDFPGYSFFLSSVLKAQLDHSSHKRLSRTVSHFLL